jgi:hypothetical protein
VGKTSVDRRKDGAGLVDSIQSITVVQQQFYARGHDIGCAPLHSWNLILDSYELRWMLLGLLGGGGDYREVEQ